MDQVATLSQDGKNLLTVIHQKIAEGAIRYEEPETYIGYKQAHELLGIEMAGRDWGASLEKQGLADLAYWTRDKSVPKVTGLIVNQTKLKPGSGYFKVFRGGKEDLRWWREQARESIAFDWSPYIDEQDIPTLVEFKQFDAAIREGELTRINVLVRSRCEALKKRARAYHRSEDGFLRCKACGWRNPSPASFQGDIVELHHIDPLSDYSENGREWTISTAIKNLVPLCPNCHRLIHALPDGNHHSLEDLIYLLKKHPQ